MSALAGLLIAQGCSEIGWLASSSERNAQVRELAGRGDAEAQVALGWMYETGRGVAPDTDAAVRWYREAAARGNALAQYALGDVYARGRGVARDYARAAKWYREAAQGGNTSAQFELGYLYENGLGVRQNYRTAAEWYDRAGRGWRERAAYPLGAERVVGAVPEAPRLIRPPRGAAAGLRAAPGPGDEARTVRRIRPDGGASRSSNIRQSDVRNWR